MRKRAQRIFFAFLLMTATGGCCILTYAGAPYAKDDVDTNTAFAIGPTKVSNYMLGKFYGRFVDNLRAHRGRLPTEAEANAWLQLFISQQAVIAEATRLGYLDRPEIQSMVLRMERNMLASSKGPYYEILRRAESESSSISPISISDAATELTVVIGRFPDRQTAESVLGPTFWSCNQPAQMERVQACRGIAGAQIAAGTLHWPFEPFPEIANRLLSAPIGNWKIEDVAGVGCYFILVTSSRYNDRIARSLSPLIFGAVSQSGSEKIFEAIHRRRILVSSRISESNDAETILASRLRDSQLSEASIPEHCLGNLTGVELCNYSSEGRTISVSVEDFRRYFNDLFVRIIPTSSEDVHRLVENLVLEAIDCHAASTLGVDRTEKFLEDRNGFAGYQALELYETEHIIPAIAIEPSAIASYYSGHLNEFTEVIAVGGQILEFSSLESGRSWCASKRNSGSADIPSVKPYRSDSVRLARGESIPGLEYLRDFPMKSPEGTLFGPTLRNGVATVFERDHDIAKSVEPLSKVASAIKSKLQAAEIDNRLLAIAPGIERALGLSCHVDLASLINVGKNRNQ
jgi:hypothetical protein